MDMTTTIAPALGTSSKKGIAPSYIWNNWHSAKTQPKGREAIARYNIVCTELSDWMTTPAVRQGEIDLVLRPFARQHR